VGFTAIQVCIENTPDGVLGADQTPSPALIDAVANGLLLDIGFGINFSYATARRMIAAGVLPHIIRATYTLGFRSCITTARSTIASLVPSHASSR
jgi:predicted amidohydrolase